MNEKNMHGRVFKKLREERGYKLKDVQEMLFLQER